MATVSSLLAWAHHLVSGPLLTKGNFKFMDNANYYFSATVIIFRFLNVNVPIFYAIVAIIRSQPEGVE